MVSYLSADTIAKLRETYIAGGYEAIKKSLPIGLTVRHTFPSCTVYAAKNALYIQAFADVRLGKKLEPEDAQVYQHLGTSLTTTYNKSGIDAAKAYIGNVAPKYSMSVGSGTLGSFILYNGDAQINVRIDTELHEYNDDITDTATEAKSAVVPPRSVAATRMIEAGVDRAMDDIERMFIAGGVPGVRRELAELSHLAHGRVVQMNEGLAATIGSDAEPLAKATITISYSVNVRGDASSGMPSVDDITSLVVKKYLEGGRDRAAQAVNIEDYDCRMSVRLYRHGALVVESSLGWYITFSLICGTDTTIRT